MVVSQRECELDPARPDLSQQTSFTGDDQQAANRIVIGAAIAAPSAPGTRAFPSGSSGGGLYNRWHQVLTVVYPPGTVAELSLEAIRE